MALHHFAVAFALVELAESLALDGCHSIPFFMPIAQIDPRLALIDGSRKNVTAAGLQPNATRSVVRRRQDASVRQRRSSLLRHFEFLLDANFVGEVVFSVALDDALHVGQHHEIGGAVVLLGVALDTTTPIDARRRQYQQ